MSRLFKFEITKEKKEIISTENYKNTYVFVDGVFFFVVVALFDELYFFGQKQVYMRLWNVNVVSISVTGVLATNNHIAVMRNQVH